MEVCGLRIQNIFRGNGHLSGFFAIADPKIKCFCWAHLLFLSAIAIPGFFAIADGKIYQV